MAEINVEILPNGEVKISVNGAKGSQCTEMTRFLEEALGEVQEREFTAEYYENQVDENITVGGGD